MMIPAFHGSASDASALDMKSRKDSGIAAIMLSPFTICRIKDPDNTPKNRDITTFFVMNASTMASSGGIIVIIPNLPAFAFAIESMSAAKAGAIVINKIAIVVMKTLKLLLFI
ncbi:hypothetical protein HMPREF3195_01574 [Peptostreptococcus anaerobius]|uniref:Uncharacterized protein n=1 Tax=Peptostreptococcus anaerobius TaxID=1261 RepID=A0A135YN42_9FIRM|nr:hypothetical protein HMPREF9998_00982 [Peptostreptococcus anaerobius VPI 4330 = DSM 2949]KXI10832.1 hypothetical protein HMPREF3195_01574 [Peptostreptococcus anaerobius]